MYQATQHQKGEVKSGDKRKRSYQEEKKRSKKEEKAVQHIPLSQPVEKESKGEEKRKRTYQEEEEMSRREAKADHHMSLSQPDIKQETLANSEDKRPKVDEKRSKEEKAAQHMSLSQPVLKPSIKSMYGNSEVDSYTDAWAQHLTQLLNDTAYTKRKMIF